MVNQGIKILLVEDEESLRKGIRLNLEAEGYGVDDAEDAREAIEQFSENQGYALGVFDIMMPGSMDGLDLCRYFRKEGHHFPIIFLTARSTLEDKLEGFDAGADDYLTKPFDLEELLARVRALLKRNRKPGKTSAGYTIGDFIVDVDACTAVSRLNNEIIRFNERESVILNLLLENRGIPVSRDMILDEAWGDEEYPTNRTIDNYIVKFRKIFESDPKNPVHFITRHGVGYELSSE